jgi:HPt (histidine-containing phosphotransfer) domain-containing protein
LVAEYPVINRETLDALRVELGAHFPRILGYFAEDGIKSLEAVEEAVRNRDAVALVLPAHTLKGESLQFGAERLGHAAEYIEEAARDGVEMRGFPLEIVEYGARLRSLFEEALTALQAEAASVAAAPAPIRRPAAGFGRKIG